MAVDSPANELSPLFELFDSQARKSPDSVAVECEEEWITYRDLKQRADQLAGYLQHKGVGPDILVAISLDRKIEMVIGLLGILKAGGAYLPLDPSYPRKRLAFMLQHSRASVLLTEESLRSQLPDFEGCTVYLDRDGPEIEKASKPKLHESFNLANLAYVIYTSGSTGQPKGVGISHSAVSNLLQSIIHVPGMTDADRVLAVTTLSFDISVTELFLPLVVGACICLVDRSVAMDAMALVKKIAGSNINYMQATPATWRMLLDAGWQGQSDLRIVSGGETLTRDLAEKLLARCGELWNLYGPTEATVWASTHRVTNGTGPVPIGIPVMNTEMLILDEGMNLVSGNQPGELYIGGNGLARGYIHDPEQTAEKFIPHPFSIKAGARLYRTGDLAQFRKDGTLLHLGRIDHQVKVRGYRIELGEIETSLEALSSIDQAVVLTNSQGSSDVRLIAYLKPAQDEPLDRSNLRAALKRTLPEYMIPSTNVFLDSFPLTPSGKVDRKALSLLELQKYQPEENGFVPPSNERQEALASLVCEVLKIDRIGIGDDLFSYGADSLKMAQIVARIRDRMAVELEQSSLFDHSTIAEMTELIDRASELPGQSETAPIKRTPRDGPLPLTFAQQRVWFLQQIYPESLAYNFQCTIRMRGPLNITALEKALNDITRRHEIYRTTYELAGDQPSQVIHAPENWELPLVDFSSLGPAEAEQAAESWYAHTFQERYDPTRLPMARWRLLTFGKRDHVLVHMEHHLVHDGWSFNLFLNELFASYAALADGRPSPLEKLPIQFADFAAWERSHMQGPEAGQQLQFWKHQLKDLPPVLELPPNKSRPAMQSFEGKAPRVELDRATCQALRQFGRSHKATLFMTMLTAFIVLLHRASGRTDVPVGTVFANRKHAAAECLIGMILNNVVIRASLDKNPSFSQLLQQVRALVLDASRNQEVPFDQVVEAVDPPRSTGQNPLFQVFFGFHDEPMPEHGPRDLDIEVTPVISNGSAKFDLGVIVIPHSAQCIGLRQGSDEDDLTLVWEYSTDLFEAENIEQLISDYRQLLKEMVGHPDQAVADGQNLQKEVVSPGVNQEASPVNPAGVLSFTPPRNKLESRLVHIWQEVIGLNEVIGVHDNFFELGGHSLLATRIINQVHSDLGYSLKFRDFFEGGTVATIAERINNSVDT